MKKIINNAEAGICCEPGNVKKLADILVEATKMSAERINQLGVNAKTYYDNNFNKNELLNEIDKYFLI